MAQAKRGDTVHVHYRGTLDDGSEFDSSAGSDPIVFTIGAGQVIPGFENAIEGMSTGDKKTEWNSKRDFGGPPSSPSQTLTPWEKLAQVLLMSDEFIFVD